MGVARQAFERDLSAPGYSVPHLFAAGGPTVCRPPSAPGLTHLPTRRHTSLKSPIISPKDSLLAARLVDAGPYESQPRRLENTEDQTLIRECRA